MKANYASVTVRCFRISVALPVSVKRVFVILCAVGVAASTVEATGGAAGKAKGSAPKTKSKVGAKRPAPKPRATPRPQIAPADEYFGRLKMSILGIANTIKDLARKADGAPLSDGLLGPARFADDSFRDWERKYPIDPWLARTGFGLEQLYIKIATPRGQTEALRQLRHLASFYGGNPYGRIARTQLTQLAPCVSVSAAPQPLLTSPPSASPLPNATGLPSPLPSGALFLATPSPSPTPFPTPLILKAAPPPQPIAAPCIPPSPSPVPVVTATPTPLPVPVPSPSGAERPVTPPSPSPTNAVTTPRPSAVPSTAPRQTPSPRPTPTAGTVPRRR